MPPSQAMINEAAQRINCFGIGIWIEQLFSALSLPMPSPTGPTPIAPLRSSGLVFRIETVDLNMPDLRDRLYISLLEGDTTSPSPFNLDSKTESIQSAKSKLSHSTSSTFPASTQDHRVSFFLDGGRVVELRFRLPSPGFDRFIVARLGAPLDWRDPLNR